MSEKIEFEVTRGIVHAMADCYDPTWGYPDASIAVEWAEKSLKAALAHPSFRKQLRAYVAGEARRLVPDWKARALDGDQSATAEQRDVGYQMAQEDCYEETLANIAAYEKEQEDGT